MEAGTQPDQPVHLTVPPTIQCMCGKTLAASWSDRDVTHYWRCPDDVCDAFGRGWAKDPKRRTLIRRGAARPVMFHCKLTGYKIDTSIPSTFHECELVSCTMS